MDQLLDEMAKHSDQNKTEEQRVQDVLDHPFFMNSTSGNIQDSVAALQSLVFEGTPEGINNLMQK